MSRYTYRVLPEAEKLITAATFWAEANVGSSDALLAELFGLLELLTVHPEMGEQAGRTQYQRRFPLKTAPFILYWRIRPKLRRLDIVSFWHTSRKPRRGARKLT